MFRFFSILLITAFVGPLSIASAGRFLLEGDGQVRLINAKTGAGGRVHYRSTGGFYPDQGRREIHRIFGSSHGTNESISLRLIALLDYLQDHFKSGPIRIVSGYRSPQYNEGLRKKGKLAARTSLHIEGMAADIEMGGVDGRSLWEFVRTLNCCGVGYYHGQGIHIDTGPSRFWDEKTTKVEQDLGSFNKLILLRTEFDRYGPGETVRMTLNRITDYPFGIRPKANLLKNDKGWKEIGLFGTSNNCALIKDRKSARNLSWIIPKDLSSDEPLKIEITFCEKPFPEMPDKILSNSIFIQ